MNNEITFKEFNNKTYKNYKKLVMELLNTNADSYLVAINEGLVVSKTITTSGEPYRGLTEDEWNEKFNKNMTNN